MEVVACGPSQTFFVFLSQLDCPQYKRIPLTDFVCDGFLYARSTLTKNYFLTHFHADHYGGISSNWDAGIIYCSLATATLVAQQLRVDKKYLHPIPMNTPTVIASRGKPVTVTLLDANHCPGAVMFLFEVGKRRILHVGDFRWNREFMLQQAPSLRSFASQHTILDELFLDTTYCNPKYSLPSQEDTIEAIKSVFEKELTRCKQQQKKQQSKTLHLFGAYTIGKEKMYLSVAEHFRMKVYVDKARFRILSALDWPKERMSFLTTNKEEACIWVVPLGHINMKKLPEYLPMANNKPFAQAYDRVIGYRPTGWSMGGKPSSTLVSSRYSGQLAIHSVPYSEHSSFPELVDCLACLKPMKIVPTVNASKSSEQVTTLLKALREKQSTFPFSKDSP
jgi:DNA cross-link repair 1A protein